MKHRILIVDDTATVRRQLSDLLQGDFDCAIACDGEEALKMIQSSAPHAIVTDLEMPNMDGVDLLRHLRNDRTTSTIPVVVATTVMSVDRVNDCRLLGCAGFVLKPVNGDYLVAKLRQLVAAR